MFPLGSQVMNRVRWKWQALAGLCVSALLLAAAPLGHAQSPDDEPAADAGEVSDPPQLRLPLITIGDDEPVKAARKKKSPEDPYAATGVKLGAFTLFPELEISAVASSNAASSSGGDGDVALRLKPSFRLESDWVRHQLSVTGDASILRYADQTDLSTTEGSLGAVLRLDVRRGTRLDIETKYALQSTGFESSEVPATAKGTRQDRTISGSAALSHEFGVIEGRAKLGVTHETYGDVNLTGGGSEDNSDRAYTEYSASLRGSYGRDAVLKPFVEAAYEPRIYTKKADRNGIRRSSQGLRLTAGVAISDDPIWQGEVGASVLYRSYDDASLEDVVSPGLTANVTWRPTDLTRFEFNAGLTLEETIAAGESATQQWTAGVLATHALRDNLDLKAGATFTLEDGSDSTLTTDASLGFDWKINPYLTLGAGYTGTWVNGDGSSSDYTEHRIIGSIILKR